MVANKMPLEVGDDRLLGSLLWEIFSGVFTLGNIFYRLVDDSLMIHLRKTFQSVLSKALSSNIEDLVTRGNRE